MTLPNGSRHDRGVVDTSAVLNGQLRQELCGLLPTGHTNSFPQLAGYYKQEVLTCQDVIQKAGLQSKFTRFGLHSQQKYFEWKQNLVYNNYNFKYESMVNFSSTSCSLSGVIPSTILGLHVADMLDIMGFSLYPDTSAITVSNSMTASNASLSNLRRILSVTGSIVGQYGRYNSGPFLGQHQEQILVVEYASKFAYPDSMHMQQEHTRMLFKLLQSRPWVLGALWWEPTWTFNDFEGGFGSLYHKWKNGSHTNEAPTSTLAYWGKYAL